MSPRLGVIANLALAVVLGSVTAQAQKTRTDYELGQTSGAKLVLAQVWWTVAGQTDGSAAGAASSAEQTPAAPLISARLGPPDPHLRLQ
jgi:hypothetical protein